LRAYVAPGPFSFWLRKHLGSTAIPILPPLGMSPRNKIKPAFASLRKPAWSGRTSHVERLNPIARFPD